MINSKFDAVLKNQKCMFCSLIIIFSLLLPELYAWGPIAHMKINYIAFDRAAANMKNSFVIPQAMKDNFVGGGPAPDIRQTMTNPFLELFHNDIPAVLEMIKIARQNQEYGTEDVAEALGWAGHLFAELYSAHTPRGYPATKKTFRFNDLGANHLITEFCVDLITYWEMRKEFKSQRLFVPEKLLESAMSSKKALYKNTFPLSASQIRNQTSNFIPTVIGIRIIAEYLISERPEMIKQMDEFFSDRNRAFSESIEDVTLMLESYGRKGLSKELSGSADENIKYDKPSGTLAARAKTFVLNRISRALDSELFNSFINTSGRISMKGTLSTQTLREHFKKIVQRFANSKAQTNTPKEILVRRFMEGLLLHKDLSFIQVLSFAEEGVSPTK
ncbi:MAG: hypothetical protein HQM10_04780 [Candidatus Riflebacteria bacterium]|nr:hypothetical protein [Candidatus Riflebacteria bacterium]